MIYEYAHLKYMYKNCLWKCPSEVHDLWKVHLKYMIYENVHLKYMMYEYTLL